MKKYLFAIVNLCLVSIATADHRPALGNYRFTMSGSEIIPRIRQAEILKLGESYHIRLEFYEGAWMESELLFSPEAPAEKSDPIAFSAALHLHYKGGVYGIVLIGQIPEDEPDILKGKAARMRVFSPLHDTEKQIAHGEFILEINLDSEQGRARQSGAAGYSKSEGSEEPKLQSDERSQ